MLRILLTLCSGPEWKSFCVLLLLLLWPTVYGSYAWMCLRRKIDGKVPVMDLNCAKN